MTYIVLDMEWSQPVTKKKTIHRGDKALSVEIIQIGAAAVRDGIILDTAFNEYIKPIYYTKLTPRISELTGITYDKLKGADDFERVLMRFRRWIRSVGDEQMIVIWGNDDVTLLKQQCEFFGCDCSWLPEWFNLQPIITKKYGINRPQMTLEAAVELVGEKSELRYHSAVNDAYYTALVLSKTDNISERLAWQRKVDNAHRHPLTSLVTTHYGRRKYENITAALLSSEANSFSCPVCGRSYGMRSHAVMLSDDEYLFVLKCCTNSSIAVSLKLVCEEDGCTVLKRTEFCGAEQKRLYNEILSSRGTFDFLSARRALRRK